MSEAAAAAAELFAQAQGFGMSDSCGSAESCRISPRPSQHSQPNEVIAGAVIASRGCCSGADPSADVRRPLTRKQQIDIALRLFHGSGQLVSMNLVASATNTE